MHLSYCTNVHPAQHLDGILAQLDTYAVPIRERLGADVLGLGLWIAAPAASGLAASAADRRRLREALGARGLEVVTLNGFPYADFQQPVVKHAVYSPDWTSPERLRYTRDLALILDDLLPAGAARGSISTLPLAWRTPWDTGRSDACRRAFDTLAKDLATLDREIRIAVEPEPGCVLETTAQAAAWLRDTDTSRIGVCLDLAHLACAWEDPAVAVDALTAAGIPIVKTQLSAALEGSDAQAFARYAEPRFLHQIRGRDGLSLDDLDEAPASGAAAQPWRVHYHVPLHAAPARPLRATTDVVLAALDVLAGRCEHFDVETYTWEVLPPGHRPESPSELVAGIAAELSWARAALAERS